MERKGNAMKKVLGRIITLLLVMTMVAGLLSACGKKKDGSVEEHPATKEINGITYHLNQSLTTDEITLTYYHFDQDETVQYLADRFMELYPNIKVVPTYINVAQYADTVASEISAQHQVDIIMYSDCDYALSNAYLADITEYWKADPETKNLASTIESAGIGTFMTGHQLAVPVKFFPTAMYVDLNCLEALNIEAPSQSWTWAEMIDLIKKASVQDSADGMAYYGLGYYNRLDSYYGIAASQNIIGEFGFNGTNFDLGVWAVGEQEFSDLKLGSYIAPSTETEEMEEWAGDWEAWCGTTGHVAIFSEAYWTYMNTWGTQNYKDSYDLNVVPYVVPAVNAADATAEHHAIATIDFGGITTSCAHPAEAYELLKFMSFGVDGWKTRVEMYNDESITNASGMALKYDVMPCPITKDAEVWEAYIQMYTKGMNDETVKAWRTYFASVMQPIPFGWTSIAGYWNYCDEYFNAISKDGVTGIHNIVDKGVAKAADYATEATKKANLFHAQAMLDYFGPGTYYNFLSEEDVAKYTKMVQDNQ